MCFPICQIGLHVFEISISPTGVPKKNMKIVEAFHIQLNNINFISVECVFGLKYIFNEMISAHRIQGIY